MRSLIKNRKDLIYSTRILTLIYVFYKKVKWIVNYPPLKMSRPKRARKSRDCRLGWRKYTAFRWFFTFSGIASQIDRRAAIPGKFSALLTPVCRYTIENCLCSKLGYIFSCRYLFTASTLTILADKSTSTIKKNQN